MNRLKIHMIRTRAIANFGRGPDKKKRKKKGLVSSITENGLVRSTARGALSWGVTPILAGAGLGTLAAMPSVISSRSIKPLALPLQLTKMGAQYAPAAALLGAGLGAASYGIKRGTDAIKGIGKPPEDNSLKGKLKRKSNAVIAALKA